MDLAKTLIRTVARAFYETKHVLVIDALMVHSALPNEDLAFLLGMQQKDLRKLCGKLREDRLLAVHTRPETREGLQRPIHKDYYYVDFHATIDAIKYRVYNLTEKVKAMYKPTEEKKDYFCPQCGAKWSQLEVLDKVVAMGFECHRCGGLLDREEPSAGDFAGHEKQSRLMSQLEKLLKLLQQIDSEDIPNNDFENAIAHAVPVQRDPNVAPSKVTIPIDGANGASSAVKGMAQTSAAPLDVSVSAGDEDSAAQQSAEAQRKASLAVQNALPVWYTTSTVTGQATVDAQRSSDSQTLADSFLKDAEEDGKGGSSNNVLSEELKAYYDQMAKEKEKEALEDRDDDAEESSEDEEEDDDEFEDVAIEQDNGGGGDTPSSSFSGNAAAATAAASTGAGVDDAKRVKDSESGSSAPVTNTSTPAPIDHVSPEGGSAPAAKKVKFKQEEEDDEDDEMEFEDAL